MRDVDGQHFSLLNHTNKEDTSYWFMQAFEKKKEQIASFWAAWFISHCFSFRHHSFNDAALSYNTYKHVSNWTLIVGLAWYCIWIGPKDMDLNLVAGVHVSSKEQMPALAALPHWDQLLSHCPVKCIPCSDFGWIQYDTFCTVFVIFTLWADERFLIWLAFFVLPPLHNQMIINLLRCYIYFCNNN